MQHFDTVKNWIRQLTEVGLLLVALGIVLQILFPKPMVFITGDIVSNLMALIKTWGDNGIIDLIALVIIL